MNLPLTPIRFLLKAAEDYGEKVGVVDGDQRLRYDEVLDRSQRLANGLRRLGIVEGDRVATLSFNCHQLLEAYYGVPIARAVLLPLNVRLSADEQTYILQHSGSKLVLFDPEFLPLAAELHESLPELQWISLLPSPELPGWVHAVNYDELISDSKPWQVGYRSYDENQIAELFYTSGSTGRPKGVMLSHRTLYLHALYTQLAAGRGHPTIAFDRVVELHTIPLFHANGWGRPHTVTFTGGRHVMLKRFEPQAVCEWVERERVTHMSMVPTMATAMVHYPDIGNYDLSSLREITLGGAASSATLVRQVEEKFGCVSRVGYGLTETGPVATAAHLKESLGELDEEERIRRQAMTGFPVPCVEVKVVDGEGDLVPKDAQTVGEALIRGDNVMDGYWNDPDATTAVFSNGWLHTGDMATWDEFGYLLIVDRKKDIIISGGENISSLEIEKVIASHPAVYEVAVIAIPDDKWGEVPCAKVVLQPGAEASEEEIATHVRKHLAGFKAPKVVEFAGELPKGATGKILKRVLREPYWKGKQRQVQGSGE